MLKAKSLKITSALSMGPVHGGTQDKIAQVVADIADMENYIVERTEAYKKKCEWGEHLSTLKGACVVWVIRQLPALPLG